MIHYLLLLLAAGAVLPFQTGMNAELARHTSPAWSAVLSFFAGAPFLFVAFFASEGRGALALPAGMGAVPTWAWFGGALGAVYVLILTYAGRFVPAALLTALIIAGQLGAALVVEHFGLAGFARHALTPMRLAGAGFLLLGVFCISRS